MKRVLKAIIGGVIIVVGFIIVLTSLIPFVRGSTDNPITHDLPPAWLLYWTDLFVKNNRLASLVLNILVYSLLTYGFLWWRDKQKPLK